MKQEAARQIEWLGGIQQLVLAYEEIAANRLQKTRDKILYSREFLNELGEIFCEVKVSYKNQVAKYHLQQRFAKSGKKAFVFIAANTGLYGDLIVRIFQQLKNDLGRENEAAIVIIGKAGQALFQTVFPNKNFTFFDFSDTVVEEGMLKKISDFLADFEEVIVYHGVFKNLIAQEIVARNITGGEMLQVADGQPFKTIFEPTLGAVLAFFETEIFASLLRQSLFEAQLARTSARVALLTQAEENIRNALKTALFEKERERHHIINQKQLSMLAGLPLRQEK